MYHDKLKRYLDIAVSVFALTLLSPFLVLVTGVLYLLNEGNPFFFQKRPGKNGEIFTIIKFKTMVDRKDQNGLLLPDDQRITWFGKLMRSTSFDEIPQLINVLKGEMSLVGPRPLLPEYLSLYTSEQSRRHNVKPGITGWAQVNGRNELSWDDKLSLDVEYVDNISFYLDAKIIFATIGTVLNWQIADDDRMKSPKHLKSKAA